jgi:1-aminocyclopropane-1-carboxylate deaminase
MQSIEPKIINPSLATVDRLDLKIFSERKILGDVLRLDKIHPVVAGNKWFKLKYYLAEAVQKKCGTLITFGGAYSNHIIATAFAARAAGLRSIGIIRGEEPAALSHTLEEAKTYGMDLQFISRERYKRKEEVEFLADLMKKYPGSWIIPEGGEGPPGIKGSTEILQLTTTNKYTHICCALGTGTMFLGLANGSAPDTEIMGFSVLKGIEDQLAKYHEKFADPGKMNLCRIYHGYHFGGYARKNDALFQFMNQFYKETGIPTDFVYTAKLFYGVIDLANNKDLPTGSSLLIVHSGGLQGNLSLPPGTLAF